MRKLGSFKAAPSETPPSQYSLVAFVENAFFCLPLVFTETSVNIRIRLFVFVKPRLQSSVGSFSTKCRNGQISFLFFFFLYITTPATIYYLLCSSGL